MAKSTANGKKDAFALFPDVLKDVFKKKADRNKKLSKAPLPPDISWLKTVQLDDQDEVPDIPTALILMPDSRDKSFVSGVLEELGYHVEVVNTPSQAIRKVQSSNINVLIQHTGFETGALSESLFHGYLNQIPIKKRRHIFYLLTGPGFHTLYNLEALSNSANLVVHEDDLEHLRMILRRSFQDFENLYSSFLEVLGSDGQP